MISIIILTYNSEKTIGKTIEKASLVSDDIHIVDSYSTDATLEIVSKFKTSVVQHPFGSYGEQRNWAINNLPIRHDWQLHLDADEYLSSKLIYELNELKKNIPDHVNGFFIPRMIRFLGKNLKHGGLFPIWHMRLFRTGKGKCEERKYDQHFYVEGKTHKLKGPMIDDHQMSLSEWVERHNRWAEAEANELIDATRSGIIAGRIMGNKVEKKRAYRHLYYKLPTLLRPFLFFLYRYVILFGFLDGKPGLIFLSLQTFWFRFLVDAKLYERRLMAKQEGRR